MKLLTLIRYRRSLIRYRKLVDSVTDGYHLGLTELLFITEHLELQQRIANRYGLVPMPYQILNHLRATAWGYATAWILLYMFRKEEWL